MKQHNSIPQHIQLELLKKQYDVYCIIHFAIWFLTRNTVIKSYKSFDLEKNECYYWYMQVKQ